MSVYTDGTGLPSHEVLVITDLAPASTNAVWRAALIAREHGYASVSVDEAICLVPRTGSLEHEYRRKVRTITRGFETLLHKRRLLNPLQYGLFAFKLWSHKLCRWAVPWSALCGLVGMILLSRTHAWAWWGLVAAMVGLALILIGARMKSAGKVHKTATSALFAIAGNFAAVHAILRAIHGDRNPTWEPTRREVVASSP